MHLLYVTNCVQYKFKSHQDQIWAQLIIRQILAYRLFDSKEGSTGQRVRKSSIFSQSIVFNVLTNNKLKDWKLYNFGDFYDVDDETADDDSDRK